MFIMVVWRSWMFMCCFRVLHDVCWCLRMLFIMLLGICTDVLCEFYGCLRMFIRFVHLRFIAC